MEGTNDGGGPGGGTAGSRIVGVTEFADMVHSVSPSVGRCSNDMMYKIAARW